MNSALIAVGVVACIASAIGIVAMELRGMSSAPRRREKYEELDAFNFHVPTESPARESKVGPVGPSGVSPRHCPTCGRGRGGEVVDEALAED